jgi:ADP-ribose pyrophosphatase
MDTLQQTILWDGKWQFRLDKVRLANGYEMDLALIEHPGSVVLVPMIGSDVLMVEQFRPVIGRHLLELPAGTLDGDEPHLDAAQRELREETGYRAETLILLGEMLPSPGTSNEVMKIFLAQGLSKDPLPMDEDEVIAIRPIPLATLVEMALRGELIDAKSVVGVLQADAFLKTA